MYLYFTFHIGHRSRNASDFFINFNFYNMEKFKLFITEQLKNAPEAEVKYRIGKQDFDNAPRTSDNTTLEMLIKGYADIAILRNAVAYEALKSVDAIKAPKVLTTSMGIASGDKLIWPAELGNTIWNGRRSPRLYTPFPNTMRADVEIANRDKKVHLRSR